MVPPSETLSGALVGANLHVGDGVAVLAVFVLCVAIDLVDGVLEVHRMRTRGGGPVDRYLRFANRIGVSVDAAVVLSVQRKSFTGRELQRGRLLPIAACPRPHAEVLPRGYSSPVLPA